MRKIRKILAAMLAVLLLAGCGNSAASSAANSADAKSRLDKRLKAAFQEDAAFSGGSGTEEDPYLISTAEDLFSLADQINGETNGYAYREAHYRMTADIDLGGKEWMPIGLGELFGRYGLCGVFDGDGHTVSGMKITADKNDVKRFYGLFGYVSGTVRNLTVSASELDVQSDTAASTGAVVGKVDFEGVIENCHVTSDVTVTGSYSTGGIAGASYGMVSGCENAASVTCTSAVGSVGGIAGQLAGSPELAATSGIMTDCSNTGTVTAGGDGGGVVGLALSTAQIIRCSNSGAVICEEDAGGILGTIHASDAESTVVTDCSNSGPVSGKQACSGIVGHSGGGSHAVLTGCTNSGDMTGGTYMGGIVGYACFTSKNAELNIADCVNSGSISASEEVAASDVGGIVACAVSTSGKLTVENCVNTGNVEGHDANAGGILGGYLSALGDNSVAMTVSLTGCSNSGNISGGSFGVGGIVGEVDASGYPAVEFSAADCTNSGSLYAQNANVLMGGIVGTIEPHHCTAVLTNCVNSGDLSCELIPLEESDGWFPFDSAMGGVIGYIGVSGIAPTLDDDCGLGDRVVITVNGCSSTGAINTYDGGMTFYTDDICAMSAVAVEIR